MLRLVPSQSQESEWMDGEDYSKEDLEESLKDLRWINRYLGGARVILRNLQELVRKDEIKSFSVLDVATGSADIPIRIVRWARKSGLHVSIRAVDKNPNIVKIAQAEAAEYPEITFEIGDFFQIPYSSSAFDYCISSLFLHHLSPQEAIPFLKRMYHLCRRAVVINDLVRSWVPYFSFRILARLFCLHPMVRHDGRISILRAFTIPEMRKLLRENGFAFFDLRQHPSYRLSLVLRKDLS